MSSTSPSSPQSSGGGSALISTQSSPGVSFGSRGVCVGGIGVRSVLLPFLSSVKVKASLCVTEVVKIHFCPQAIQSSLCGFSVLGPGGGNKKSCSEKINRIHFYPSTVCRRGRGRGIPHSTKALPVAFSAQISVRKRSYFNWNTFNWIKTSLSKQDQLWPPQGSVSTELLCSAFWILRG